MHYHSILHGDISALWNDICSCEVVSYLTASLSAQPLVMRRACGNQTTSRGTSIVKRFVLVPFVCMSTRKRTINASYAFPKLSGERGMAFEAGCPARRTTSSGHCDLSVRSSAGARAYKPENAKAYILVAVCGRGGWWCGRKNPNPTTTKQWLHADLNAAKPDRWTWFQDEM
jgi:hypothetical protein